MSGNTAEGGVELALGLLETLGLEGEVYLEEGRSTKVTVSDGEVEALEERRDLGLGLRVYESGGVGFSFTTDPSADAVRGALLDARDIARHVDPDAAWRAADPRPAEPLPFPNEDAAAARTPVATRIAIAVAIEKAARAVDPRVRKTRQSVYQDSRERIWIANTRGLSACYAATRAMGFLETTASEGDASQVGFHAEFGLGPDGLNAEAVGRVAAEKALAKLGARPASTGRVRAVLHREVVGGLLEALAPAFSARRVLKGTSLLEGRLGRRIAADEVELADDPRLPGGFGSVPVDGEGIPTRRVPLVQEGRLEGYLFDTYSAAKMGTGAPGNTVRGGYDSPPRIAPMNLVLRPGSDPLDVLVERAGEGVYVTEVMGLHTVDPVSGDFSVGASGRTIERGKLSGPVDRMALSGNLLELLGAVEAVGADLELFPGGGGAPSVLLRELSVAGKS